MNRIVQPIKKTPQIAIRIGSEDIDQTVPLIGCQKANKATRHNAATRQ